MCDAEIPEQIYWKGWKTSWKELRANGWVISAPLPYSNWRSPRQGTPYIYIRHPETRMIGRGVAERHGDERFLTLEFLTPERNATVKPPRVMIQRDLQEEDIQELLEKITEIQAKRVRRREPGDVVDITPYLSVHGSR